MHKGTGSYRTYLPPSTTATFVPLFAVEDLPLSRTVPVVPEFAVKDLPLGRTLDADDDEMTNIYNTVKLQLKSPSPKMQYSVILGHASVFNRWHHCKFYIKFFIHFPCFTLELLRTP